MLERPLTICAALCGIVLVTPVTASTLPVAIQTCIINGSCTNPLLVQQTQTFSAYTYEDSGTDRYLFAYHLSSRSGEFTNSGATPLSGTAWIGANASYDLTQDRHFFDLYLDTVAPEPTNLWVLDSNGLDTQLSVSTTDLLGGNGYFRLGEDADSNLIFEGELGTHGDLGQGGYPAAENHSFLPCLAATCEVGAEFNLLYMQFIETGSVAGLVINTADQRGLLYSQYRDWAENDSWYRMQSYRVIPLPAGIWLFVSAVAGLISIRRH